MGKNKSKKYEGISISAEKDSVDNSEVIDFKQAFRIFKKKNAPASLWTESAVEVFAKKKLGKVKNSYEKWATVFAQY